MESCVCLFVCLGNISRCSFGVEVPARLTHPAFRSSGVPPSAPSSSYLPLHFSLPSGLLRTVRPVTEMTSSATGERLKDTPFAAGGVGPADSSTAPITDCIEHHGERTVDVKAFLKKIGGGPVHTRARLEHALEQLKKARKGEQFELLDCYGKTHLRGPEIGYVFLRP